MVWTKNLECELHAQDTDYYCGAAVAQMILNFIGAGLLDQNILYSYNRTHNVYPQFPTDPYGLTAVLNDFAPPEWRQNFFFDHYEEITEAAGSAKIVHTLWRYGVPTGTVVYRCGHWIVVRGVSTDVEPVEGAEYTINGFWINDPWPNCASYDDPTAGPPPPHSSDDACVTGENGGGVANEYIVYDNAWKDVYFTGCDAPGDLPVVFVSVCDPDVPRMGKLSRRRKPFWARGDRLIKAEEATKFASRGVDYHNLLENKSFANALHNAKPASPMLVQRLDLPDSFYNLIPMVKDDKITAVLSVDALHGNFRGGYVLIKPVKSLIIDQKKALEKVLQRPVDLGRKHGRITLRTGGFSVYPAMVWRPCKESRSPYFPFHMITVGSSTLYIGYDGRVYPELHDLGCGGGLKTI